MIAKLKVIISILCAQLLVRLNLSNKFQGRNFPSGKKYKVTYNITITLRLWFKVETFLWRWEKNLSGITLCCTYTKHRKYFCFYECEIESHAMVFTVTARNAVKESFCWFWSIRSYSMFKCCHQNFPIVDKEIFQENLCRVIFLMNWDRVCWLNA